MNIWWINHHARPPVVPGGTRHYNLAKELKKLGHRTTIINGTFDHLGPLSNKGDATYSGWRPLKETYDGVPFFSIPTPRYSGNASFGRIWNMVAFMVKTVTIFGWAPPTEKPDVIIGSTVHPLAAFAGLILSRIHRVPFVYEVRDLWPLTLLELGKISPRHPAVALFGLLDRILARSASTILITAPLMYKYYQERYSLPKDRFLWVTNGTNTHEFELENTRTTNKVRKIVYAGALGPANGLENVLNAMALIKEEDRQSIELQIFGQGTSMPSLREFSAKHGLNVTFHSPVAKKTMPRVLAQADILLFSLVPSKIFRFGISPNKLADYHAAGKPIIAIGEYAQNPVLESRGGVVVSNSREKIARCISYMAKAPDSLLDSMGKKARSYAEKNYEWGYLAEKLENTMCQDICRVSLRW
ncbi:MAG: glycosyltransferase family 4 protein [Synergistota bacterium]|nr:glycosyltransferase family 4 protein [Synergistota bacterium]